MHRIQPTKWKAHRLANLHESDRSKMDYTDNVFLTTILRKKNSAASTDADLYKSSTPAFVHCWRKYIRSMWKILFSNSKIVSSNKVIVLRIPVGFSVEIDMLHYFRSNPALIKGVCEHSIMRRGTDQVISREVIINLYSVQIISNKNS